MRLVYSKLQFTAHCYLCSSTAAETLMHLLLSYGEITSTLAHIHQQFKEIYDNRHKLIRVLKFFFFANHQLNKKNFSNNL